MMMMTMMIIVIIIIIINILASENPTQLLKNPTVHPSYQHITIE